MSAYRQAMLSVAPDRLEQFSIMMKQDINDKEKRKKAKHSSSRKPKKSSKSSSSKTSKTSKTSKSSKSSKSESRKARKSSREARRSHEGQRSDLTDSDTEEGGLDLGKPLHPLSFFVKDRASLLDEVFSVIRDPKLLAMLPDGREAEEVKRSCLAQLEVMSSERVLRVINGEDLDFSSGTDSEPGSDRSLQRNVVDSTTSLCDVIIPASMRSHDSDCEIVSSSKPEVGRRRVSVKRKVAVTLEERGVTLEERGVTLEERDVTLEERGVVVVTEEEEYTEMVDEMLEESLHPAIEDKPTQSEDKPTHSEDKLSRSEDKPSRSEDKKMSQLEVLELEMRARAIKSLAAKRR